MNTDTGFMKEFFDAPSTAVAQAVITTQAPSDEKPRRSISQSIVRMSATRANSRIGLACDVALVFVLLYSGTRRHDVLPITALLTIFLGLVLFSLVEYCFHRWVFHGPRQVLEQGHRKHHQDPWGHDSLPFFLPPLGMLGLAALLVMFFPATIALLLSGGMAFGYAAYGLSHWAIHRIRFRYSLPRRWAAAHHVHHHHPNRNFGVTTPLWDIMLRTRYGSKRTKSTATT